LNHSTFINKYIIEHGMCNNLQKYTSIMYRYVDFDSSRKYVWQVANCLEQLQKMFILQVLCPALNTKLVNFT
jgi:hypothetical protein